MQANRWYIIMAGMGILIFFKTIMQVKSRRSSLPLLFA